MIEVINLTEQESAIIIPMPPYWLTIEEIVEWGHKTPENFRSILLWFKDTEE